MRHQDQPDSWEREHGTLLRDLLAWQCAWGYSEGRRHFNKIMLIQCVCVLTPVSQPICGEQRTTYRSPFSPPTMILRLELRESGLEASTFVC